MDTVCSLFATGPNLGVKLFSHLNSLLFSELFLKAVSAYVTNSGCKAYSAIRIQSME